MGNANVGAKYEGRLRRPEGGEKGLGGNFFGKAEAKGWNGWRSWGIRSARFMLGWRKAFLREEGTANEWNEWTGANGTVKMMMMGLFAFTGIRANNKFGGELFGWIIINNFLGGEDGRLLFNGGEMLMLAFGPSMFFRPTLIGRGRPPKFDEDFG
jgi:hypothetical protein